MRLAFTLFGISIYGFADAVQSKERSQETISIQDKARKIEPADTSNYIFSTNDEIRCTLLPQQHSFVFSAKFSWTLNLCVIRASMTGTSLTVGGEAVEVEKSVPIYPHGSPEPWKGSRLWPINVQFRDSDFPKAWNVYQGLQAVVPAVAVFDSGVNDRHPDLYYTPPGGYKTQVVSKDSRNFFTSSDEECGFCDKTGHGTMVSLMIASSPSGSLSISGGLWMGAEIIMLKVMEEVGDSASVVLAIDYLLSTRPDVEVSAHAYGTKNGLLPVHLATAFARLHESNHLAIGSSGNDAQQFVESYSVFPCCLDSVMCVGNFNLTTGSLHTSSNYGSRCVSLGAAGFAIVPVRARNSPPVRMFDASSVSVSLVVAAASLSRISNNTVRNATLMREVVERSTRKRTRLNGAVSTSGALGAYSAIFRRLQNCTVHCPATKPWLCHTLQCVEYPAKCRDMGTTVLNMCPTMHTCASWSELPQACPAGMRLSTVNAGRQCGSPEFVCHRDNCCDGCEPIDQDSNEMQCANGKTCHTVFDSICCDNRSRCPHNYPYMCKRSAKFSVPQKSHGISRSGDSGRCQLASTDCAIGGGVVDHCPTTCAAPDLTGYNIKYDEQHSLDALSFSVAVVCAEGYQATGFPRAIKCTHGETYTVEGCIPANFTTCLPCDDTCDKFDCSNFVGATHKTNASHISCKNSTCSRKQCCDGLQLGLGECSSNGRTALAFGYSRWVSPAQCAESCADRQACVGFSYLEGTDTCKLHQVMPLSNAGAQSDRYCILRHARYAANWPLVVVDGYTEHREQGADCPDTNPGKSRYVYIPGGIGGATTVKRAVSVASCVECASSCAEFPDCNGYYCVASGARFDCQHVDFPIPASVDSEKYICALKDKEYDTPDRAPSCDGWFQRRPGYVAQRTDAGFLEHQTGTSCSQCSARCAALGTECGLYQCSDSARICTLFGNADIVPDLSLGDVLMCVRTPTAQCIMQDGTMLHGEDCVCAFDGTTICHRGKERCQVTKVVTGNTTIASGACLRLRDCEVCAKVGCPDVLAPVCADNMATYVNRCAAECVNHEVLWLGTCDNSTNAAHCKEVDVDDHIVCGSDQKSYMTECFALATPGVTVVHRKRCGVFCTTPSEADRVGYKINAEHSLDSTTLNITVGCATGFIPSDVPHAMPCERDGEPYILEGCVNASEPACPCVARTTCMTHSCKRDGTALKSTAEEIICPSNSCSDDLCCDGIELGDGGCASATGVELPAFSEIAYITLSHCSDYCAHQPSCVGFTYKNSSVMCKLHSEFPLHVGKGPGSCFARHERFSVTWPIVRPTGDFYLGCFELAGSGEAIHTTERCHQHCMQYDTFSMTGSTCRCHNWMDYNDINDLPSRSDDRCLPVCAGETQLSPPRYCGDSDSMALYDVLQVEQGTDCPDSERTSRYVYIRGGTDKTPSTTNVPTCVACAVSCANSGDCNGFQCVPNVKSGDMSCRQWKYPVPTDLTGKQYMCVPKAEEYDNSAHKCSDQYDMIAGFVVENSESGWLEGHNTGCGHCSTLCSAHAVCELYQCSDSLTTCSLFRRTTKIVRDVSLIDVLLCVKFPTAQCGIHDGTVLHGDNCLCGRDGATVCRAREERCSFTTEEVNGYLITLGKCIHVRECETCTTVGCSGVFSHVCARNGRTYDNRCKAECSGQTVARLGTCDNSIQATHCAETSLESDIVCGTDGKNYMNDCFARATPGVAVFHLGVCGTAAQCKKVGETNCFCNNHKASFCTRLESTFCALDSSLSCIPACDSVASPLRTDCFCSQSKETICTHNLYCASESCVPSLCSSMGQAQSRGSFSDRVCPHTLSSSICVLSYDAVHASCNDLCEEDDLTCEMAWLGVSAKCEKDTVVSCSDSLANVVCQCSDKGYRLRAPSADFKLRAYES